MQAAAPIDMTGQIPTEVVHAYPGLQWIASGSCSNSGLDAYAMHLGFSEPVRIAGCDTEPRLHISVLLQGSLDAQGDGRRLRFEPHQAMLAQLPGVPWTMQLQGQIREVGLLIAPQALEQLAGEQGQEFHSRLMARGAFALHAADPATLQATNELAALLLGEAPGGALLREAKSLEVLARIMQCHGDAGAAVPAAARRRLQHARELLLANPAQAPTIDALARACGMNSFSLKQGFKQLFGTTMHALHQYERMRLAWRLIESSEMNVTEAGEHVGYANLSHFGIAFKKQFGLLPSELRRRVAWATNAGARKRS